MNTLTSYVFIYMHTYMHIFIYIYAYLKHIGFGLIFSGIPFLLLPYIKGCFDQRKSTLNWNSKRLGATSTFQSEHKTRNG